MSKDNGGPAFPGAVDSTAPQGMSLRDWFAGQALVGILANEGTKTFDELARKQTEEAYWYADAMLDERKK